MRNGVLGRIREFGVFLIPRQFPQYLMSGGWSPPVCGNQGDDPQVGPVRINKTSSTPSLVCARSHPQGGAQAHEIWGGKYW